MKRLIYSAILVSITATAFARTGVSSDAESVTISNDSVSATFATGKAFDILSLKDAKGHESVKPGINKKPWTLTYRGVQGQTPELDPSTALYQGYRTSTTDSTTTLTFVWNTRLNYDGGDYPVEMSVTLADNSPLLEWDLSAALPEGWSITDFKFPTLYVSTPESAKVIRPGGWGNEYKLEPAGHYEANYPSWSGSMQLMMIDDGDGVYFYSPRDYNASGKLMTVDVKGASTVFNTKVVASEGWNDHTAGRFSVPWTTVTGRHPADWGATAIAWYRPFALSTEWGSQSLDQRDIPDWMLHKDLWLRAKEVNDTTVAAVHKAIDYFGEDIAFHWYFWHHHAYDSHYPDYFPADPRFAPIVKGVRDRNCQVMPYINGRLWDPSTDSYGPRNGKEASVRRPDGNLYTEIYPTSLVPNSVTCPASPIWHDIILELADRIQDELGTNGLYIDQIAAAAPYPCYAENHGHPVGGGEFWYHAYRDMMKDLRRDHLRPGNVVFSEENAECYIPSFDILLTVNTPHAPDCKIVPLFPMIYADRTLTTAFTYSPYQDVTQGDFRYENMQCLLYGAQLGWVDPRLLWVNDKAAYETKFLKNLVEFRKKQHDVFIGGRYIREFIPEGDNPIADIPVFGKDYMVKGAEWLSPSGQRVLYVVNSDSKPHEVTLPTGKKVKLKPISAERYNLN